MTEDESNQTPGASAAADPKEAMRQALERKRGSQQHPHGPSDRHRDGAGKAHGQAGGRREFRRKAGG